MAETLDTKVEDTRSGSEKCWENRVFGALLVLTGLSVIGALSSVDADKIAYALPALFIADGLGDVISGYHNYFFPVKIKNPEVNQ